MHNCGATASLATIGAMFLGGVSLAAMADVPVGVVGAHRFVLSIDNQPMEVPYERTHSLDEANTSIERLVVVVHSSNRDPAFALNAVSQGAVNLGIAHKVLVVAPQFLIEDDLAPNGLGNEVLFWSGGWRRGHMSRSSATHPRSVFASSFTIVDTMIERIADPSLFPSLQQVIVLGHSAGGRFVNRYAAGNPVEDLILAPLGIKCRYVMSAPGSLLYFDSQRRIEGTIDQFAEPSAAVAADCPYYNDYQIDAAGLDALNSYMSQVGRDAIRDQYRRREVIHLVGALDTALDDPGGCLELLQGAHHVERIHVYFNYLRHYYGDFILSKHRKGVVPGVGHSTYAVYGSEYGLRYIFDYEGSRMVLHVDADSSPGGDGLTWATAFQDLQDAIITAAATGGEVSEIWVADGTYRPDSGTGDRERSFQLINNVGIYGGFAGIDSLSYPGGESLKEQREPEANVVILSGDLSANDGQDFTNYADNSYHIVTGSGTDSSAILDGFVLTGGNATSDYPHDRGGGMLNLSGHPTITNCVFTANEAGFGGAIANDEQSSPTLEACTIIGNRAIGAAGGGGGIVCLAGSHATITDCVIRNNQSSPHRGGGVYCHSSSPLLTGCLVEGNAGGFGGGMACYNGSQVTMVDSIIAGNSAGIGGGWRLARGSDAVITNCVISGNSADTDGGGLSIWSGTAPVLTNCLISGNRSAYGGGLHCWDNTSPRVTNCVIASNTADYGGGVRSGMNSLPVFANCIFSANLNHAFHKENDTGTPTVSYCQFDDNFGGVYYDADTLQVQISAALAQLVLEEWDNNRDGAPLFVADRMGTWTEAPMYNPITHRTTLTDSSACWEAGELAGTLLTPDAVQGMQAIIVSNSTSVVEVAGDVSTSVDIGDAYRLVDYHLQLASPCIDAGDNSMVPPEISADLDGNLRFRDIPSALDTGNPGTPGTPVVDIGAYEFNLVIPNDYDTDGDVDESDLAAFMACFFGPGVPLAPGCDNKDRDHDNDVDQSDYGFLQRCYSGALIPADPDCE